MKKCRRCSTVVHEECRVEHGGSCPVCGANPPGPKIRAHENIYRRSTGRPRHSLLVSSRWTWDTKVLVTGLFLLVFGLFGLLMFR